MDQRMFYQKLLGELTRQRDKSLSTMLKSCITMASHAPEIQEALIEIQESVDKKKVALGSY